MLGSAAQNIIGLTDSLFMYYYDENDFAAVGYVSVFYMILSAVGFGFSKGGQILIARKLGERNYEFVGNYFYAVLIFEFLVGLVLYLVLRNFGSEILSWFIQSNTILEKCKSFLSYRIYGLVFAYVGLSFLSLYLGMGRPGFILIDTVILAISNVFLCYCLVFGRLGLPEMGIAGAGLASSLSEIFAFACFLVYMVFDRRTKTFALLKFRIPQWSWFVSLHRISYPIIFQGVLGMGSWFLFFTLIEKLGEKALAISNMMRMVYLILAIPFWGYSTAINTIISKSIGMRRQGRVMRQVHQSAFVSLITSAVIAVPVLLLPSVFLRPLLWKQDDSLLGECAPYFLLLLVIFLLNAVTTMYFNAVSGTGESMKGLKIQGIATVFYLSLAAVAVYWQHPHSLYWAWASEIAYWLIQLFLSIVVLKSGKWLFLKI